MSDNKRLLPGEGSEAPASKRPSASIIGISRSIAACQRCRSKKIRCDQNFPKCAKCSKAGVDCVGLDPATGREVPRSYVIHLEDRIAMLEKRMRANGLDPNAADSPDPNKSGPSSTLSTDSIDTQETLSGDTKTGESCGVKLEDENNKDASNEPDNEKDLPSKEPQEEIMMERVASVTMNSGSTAPSSYLGATAMISFAKLMLTAVKLQNINSTTASHAESTPELPTALRANGIMPAILPPKSTAQEFIKIYFAQQNSQLPILHREQFVKNVFIPIYGKLDPGISLASNYTAINTSIFQEVKEEDTWFYQYKTEIQALISEKNDKGESVDPVKISNSIIVPAKFHIPLYFLNIIFAIASSVHQLQYPSSISDAFKTAAIKYIEPVYASQDKLESLQGILLLTLYSIMRPAVPGVWYVLGSALRVCVDLGLHTESSKLIDSSTKDMRRRLFWCTYSLDRQVCVYLGRPFGIPEESINTYFPSELDDALIVPGDNSTSDYSNNISGMPTYKVVSLSMFKIRQIQAEVQKILYERSELPRRFATLNEWRKDISKRLKNWKMAVPKTQRKMNCDFHLEFFSLNYNHTLLMLHGLSPKNLKLTVEDFNKVSEASKEVINAYHQLYLNKSVNYTWVCVHNLFMSGTSYLYSIYNNELVRQQNSIHEVKKITQDCITVLNSLIDRCDAAANCRDTFEMLTAAVVKLRYNEIVSGVIGVVNNPVNEHSTLEAQTGGPMTSNLQHLVENINVDAQSQLHRERIAAQQQQFQEQLRNQQFQQAPQFQGQLAPNQFEQIQVKIENDLNPFDFPNNHNVPRPQYMQPYGAPPGVANTPTHFEWTSNSDKELDHFFSELENLSPLSQANSPGTRLINSHNQAYANASVTDDNISNASSSGNFQNTPLSADLSTGSSPHPLNIVQQAKVRIDSGNDQLNRLNLNKTYPSTKDGQKVFEMIYQVPAESIWDQFFASPMPRVEMMGNEYASATPNNGQSQPPTGHPS